MVEEVSARFCMELNTTKCELLPFGTFDDRTARADGSLVPLAQEDSMAAPMRGESSVSAL
eukprot:12881622-Prorocentrum_lima.AAC.1